MFVSDNLYKKIVEAFPVSVVDLVVVDRDERILLLKRQNAPAKGAWWFPGGRVLHGESRHAAAIRKLREECGLVATACCELSTYDMLFKDCRPERHVVSTIFLLRVESSKITLDCQSSSGEWHICDEWKQIGINNVVSCVLEKSLAGLNKKCRSNVVQDVLIYGPQGLL